MKMEHLILIQQIILHVYFVKSMELATSLVPNPMENDATLPSRALKFTTIPVKRNTPSCRNSYQLQISTVICKHVDEDHQFIRKDANVKNSSVVVYVIVDSSITNFVKGSLNYNLTINTFILRNSKVKHFELFNGFYGLEQSLDNIRLDNVDVTKWTFSSGANFLKLKDIWLYMASGAQQWPVDPIIPCLPEHLTTIYLGNFVVRSLKNFTFARFKDLDSLSLVNNGLTFVDRNFLARPAHSLRKLELSYNPITFLPDDMFIDMPNLTMVSLEYTKFTTLSYEIFKPVFGTLRELKITGIPLTCDCETAWLHIKKRVWKISNVKCNLPPSMKNRAFNTMFLIDICMNCNELKTN